MSTTQEEATNAGKQSAEVTELGQKEGRTKADAGSTVAPSRDAVTLNELGTEIEELHDLAERGMRTSLDYARLAGVKLIEAKRLVRYGQWQSWVATRCGFSQATANLYMKIAREWNQYAESQRVGIHSLRDAARLLYMDNDEEHANAVGDLANLGLIRWSDLDGLDPIERRTFVTEVRSFYDDYCVDDFEHKVSDELKAARVAKKGGGEQAVQYSHLAIKAQAHALLSALKAGGINRHQVRAKLRFLPERGATAAAKSQSAPRMTVRYLSPLETYIQFADRFRWATRDLFTGPHGLLGLLRPDERPPFSCEACESVLRVVVAVRKAVGRLEEQARERIHEYDVADAAATVVARSAAYEADCEDDGGTESIDVPSELATVQ
ncbi:MAG: DUF3102 domain-containing protein [Gemmatimonadaceae bacterium]